MVILSIIIPVYNQEELIKKAINSVPIRDDLEIIVVDDASTDKTIQSVQSLNRRDVKIIKVSNRQTIGFCRNLGLEAATGKFMFSLDSDDYLITDEFNKFIEFVYKNQWCDVIHSDIIDNRGNLNKGISVPGTPTKTYKIESVRRFNLKFENITVGEDLVFWNDFKRHKIVASYYKKLFYHYNYPREGSTTWLAEHNKIRRDCDFIKR